MPFRFEPPWLTGTFSQKDGKAKIRRESNMQWTYVSGGMDFQQPFKKLRFYEPVTCFCL